MSHTPENYSDLDQTRFSVEEPLYEGMGSYPEDLNKQDLSKKVPLFRQRKFIIGLIIGVIFLVVLLLIIINAIIAKNRTPQAPIATPLIVNSKLPDGPLEEKIKFLQSELEVADPNKSDFGFPAVDFTIRLDPEN